MKLSALLPIIAFLGASAIRAEEPEKEESPEVVIATVGDLKVTEDSRESLGGIVLGKLLEDYAAGQKIAATDEEIANYVAGLVEGEKKEKAHFEKRKVELTKELESGTLADEERENKKAELASIEDILANASKTDDERTAEEKKETDDVRRDLARAFITSWKVNKALFEKYGGRVIYQQAGPEPLDAYRKFLEEQSKAGTFKLTDPKYETDLWRTYRDDSLHVFVPDGEREKEIQMAPWERPDPEEEE